MAQHLAIFAKKADRRLPTRALPVLAPRPAAGPAFALLKLFLGTADAALSGFFLLGVFDPADELVACQRRDVLPRRERGVVADERGTQVGGKVVDDTARNLLTAHEGQGSGRRISEAGRCTTLAELSTTITWWRFPASQMGVTDASVVAHTEPSARSVRLD
jgi:hypothetical protein